MSGAVGLADLAMVAQDPEGKVEVQPHNLDTQKPPGDCVQECAVEVPAAGGAAAAVAPRFSLRQLAKFAGEYELALNMHISNGWRMLAYRTLQGTLCAIVCVHAICALFIACASLQR